MAARRFDLARTAPAVLAQAETLPEWLSRLAPTDWDAATPLPGWSVAVLVGHLTQTLRVIAGAAPTGARAGAVADYLARLPAAAAQISERETAAAVGKSPADLREEYDRQLDAARRTLAVIAATAVVEAPRGPLIIGDFLATRAVELVAHTDDLARALPDNPPAIDTAAARVAVRLLADVLAVRNPGKSVEVRIPPYAAVQCITGPRHTRGTPPNVVETDPVTWVRLATGRTSFADAVAAGACTASGERSDLSGYLPVLA